MFDECLKVYFEFTFVRLLVLLISNVLSCFSVLVCCRSLVQKVAQRGEMKQRRS
jgi:hypothetical protein